MERSDEGLSDHARQDREFWDKHSDSYHERNVRFTERGLAWGLWQSPEAELRILGDVAGKDVLELGCGAAEWSRALAHAGARATGLDTSEARPAHAREAVAREGVDVRLPHASAESVPLADASFDVVFCDWIALTSDDPYVVVPEAARLLRPGGLFAFSGATPIGWLAFDEAAGTRDERVRRPSFGMHRWEAVEFNLPYGVWIRLAREHGFSLESPVELRPPAQDAPSGWTYVTQEWARQWPSEALWRFRKR